PENHCSRSRRRNRGAFFVEWSSHGFPGKIDEKPENAADMSEEEIRDLLKKGRDSGTTLTKTIPNRIFALPCFNQVALFAFSA
ncbi:MAG: hypothetical protein ACI9R3_004487, partial [Verrucomicrobiales bacterium]